MTLRQQIIELYGLPLVELAKYPVLNPFDTEEENYSNFELINYVFKICNKLSVIQPHKYNNNIGLIALIIEARVYNMTDKLF